MRHADTGVPSPWETVLNAMADWVSLLDLDHRVLRTNNACERFVGLPAQDAVGRSCCSLIHRADEPIDGCPMVRMTETKRRERLEIRTSEARWLLVIVDPVLDAEGKLIGAVHMVRDISERRRAEEELRRNGQYNRILFETTPVGLALCRPDGTFLDVNPAYARIIGRTVEETLELGCRDITPAKYLKENHSPWDRLQETGRCGPYEKEYIHKDGHLVPVRCSDILLEKEEAPCILSSVEDIATQKGLQEQLMQAQKMEAIGTLAGGVAHDFNNLLTTIIGNAHIALMEMPKDHSLREEITEIREAGERASTLTRQLLAFSRKQVIKAVALDLNEVIAGVEKMLRRLIGEDIELEVRLADRLRPVLADPTQIDQVIMNLAVNARDAMPRGGKLTIEVADTELDESFFHARGVEPRPGPYVELTVGDTGVGMDRELQTHIFEPFYTTKKRGRGTGLGLSTLYGILKQNGGYIWVSSEPGEGSVFHIYLPIAEEVEDAAEQADPAEESPPASETILLAEDDEALRNLARKILDKKGYTVLTAPNGEEALRAVETWEGPIHLLITDVVMPGMSGKELAERMESLRPGIKILYMSGYADDAVVRHGMLEGEMDFIEKPFTPAGLVARAREALDNP